MAAPQSRRFSLLRSQPWLRNFVVILLVLGVFFRLYQLGGKVYWHDETMTSLRISGYTQSQFIQQVYGGETLSAGELLARYQYPNEARGWDETWQALAEHPEHSPAYYVLARLWLQVAPHSVTAMRLLSALVGLLTLPAMFWLTQALFQSPSVAWVTTALFAVSPFQVLYSQEAREYSLWTLALLVSSAALLSARRWKGWAGYGLSAAAALYVHPFSAFMLMSHGLYVALTRKRQDWWRFAGAIALAVLLFAPWLAVVMQNFGQFTGNTASVNANRAGQMPLFWLLNLSRVFVDFNQGPSAINPVHYLLAALAIAALINLCRSEPRQRWAFVITLVGVMGLALIGPDVLLGGRRSSITRYAVPAYLGLQVAVGHFLAQRLVPGLPASQTPVSQTPKRRSHRAAQSHRAAHRASHRGRWRGVAIALALGGVLSCAVSAQVPVWWHKSYAKSRRLPDVAEVVNASDRPLLLSDRQPAGRVLTLTHLLRPDVPIQLVEKPNQVDLPSEPMDLLVFLPSRGLGRRLTRQLERRGERLEPVQFEAKENEPWLLRTPPPE
ncbi:MAG: glycosyltransferase family 39 protein [Elainellaceae cyanobacterium]